jgi:DNA repair protein RAD16
VCNVCCDEYSSPYIIASQAIDRTHRIGQHKPIYATRFIVRNTVEERILRLQEKKKLVFDGTVGGDAASMAKLSVDDMRFLFQ